VSNLACFHWSTTNIAVCHLQAVSRRKLSRQQSLAWTRLGKSWIVSSRHSLEHAWGALSLRPDNHDHRDGCKIHYCVVSVLGSHRALRHAASYRSTLAIEQSDIDIGEQLGSGGFSVVYRGEWIGTPVAVKMWFDSNATVEQRSLIRQEIMTVAVRSAPVLHYLPALRFCQHIHCQCCPTAADMVRKILA
jgi:hypothetical protein